MKNKLIKFFRSLFTSHQSPARHASQLAGVAGRLITNHYSQSGFAFIAIILIVLVIFSISIVSGADDFAFSPDPTGKPTPTTSPTATPSAGTITPTPTPTPTPNQSSGWSINYVIENCENGIARGKVNATGPANGYMTLELQNSSGNYSIQSSEAFLPPDGPGPSTLTLKSSAGYNNTPWRLNLFEGGSGSRDNYSGGTLRTSIQGTPTNCP